MRIYIKNMVCLRCKMVVKTELEKLGLHYSFVELGEAIIEEEATEEQLLLLNNALQVKGLELLENRRLILIEKIITTIIELVHFKENQLKVNLSDYLSEKLDHNYTYLANIFSETKGLTIEHYYINHKIERIKQLLAYDELNLTEIAFKLYYSSVAHLSNQFKKMTGLTPTHFRNLNNHS